MSTRQLKAEGGGHMLYLVEAKTSFASWVKVGITSELFGRVRSIACGCPVPIDVVWHRSVGDIVLADWAELAVHAVLEPQRSSGEWFGIPCDEALREQVDSIVGRFCKPAQWKSVRFDESPWRQRTNRAEKLSQLAERRAESIQRVKQTAREFPFRPDAPLSESMSVYRPQ